MKALNPVLMVIGVLSSISCFAGEPAVKIECEINTARKGVFGMESSHQKVSMTLRFAELAANLKAPGGTLLSTIIPSISSTEYNYRLNVMNVDTIANAISGGLQIEFFKYKKKNKEKPIASHPLFVALGSQSYIHLGETITTNKGKNGVECTFTAVVTE